MRYHLQTIGSTRIAVHSVTLFPTLAQRQTEEGEQQVTALSRVIRLTGKVEPIVVRPKGEDEYELLAGALRWKAAQRAELSRIAALICDEPAVDAALATLMQLTTKRPCNSIAAAEALQTMLEHLQMATHEDLAALCGVRRNVVSHYLLLLELAPAVRKLLEQRRLSFGHGRALSSRKLARQPDRQIELARKAVQESWSVRQLESAICGGTSSRPQQNSVAPAAPTVVDPNILKLAEKLTQVTGSRVQFEHQPSGEGRLIFNYHSLEACDNVLRFFPLE